MIFALRAAGVLLVMLLASACPDARPPSAPLPEPTASPAPTPTPTPDYSRERASDCYGCAGSAQVFRYPDGKCLDCRDCRTFECAP